MENLTQPTELAQPFAINGDKNTIPKEYTSGQRSTNPQLADQKLGFPEVTSKLFTQGGLPPERKDFNGLGYLTTLYDYFYQAGGTFTYNTKTADDIGGYPLNARLWYNDGTSTYLLRSTKANNKDNFITNPSVIGTSWVVDIPSISMFQVVNNAPTQYVPGVIYFVRG